MEIDAAKACSHVDGLLSSQLFDQVPCAIALLDRDFTIIQNNKCFSTIFGDGRGGLCYGVYKRRSDPCPNCMALKTFEDGQTRIHEEVGIDRDGRTANYVVQVSPVLDKRGTITHVIEMSTDITGLKGVEREYESLFEGVPCFIAVLDRDLRVVRANKFIRDMFGDGMGDHCFQNYKQRKDKCPDCPAEQTFVDGGIHTTTQIVTSKNGRENTFIVTTSPLRESNDQITHVIEMAIDVTQINLLRERLGEAYAFRGALVESGIDAIVATDINDQIIVFNRAAERLFGCLGSELQGRPVPKDMLPSALPQNTEWTDNRVLLTETTVQTKEKTDIPVRFSGMLLEREEQVIGRAFFMQDLRPIKQLEHEKLEAERLAAVGQTVAGLAHGIKNILTGLEGGMYIMKKGRERGAPDRIELGWDMLERNIVLTSTLVQNLLTFSKGATPKTEIVWPGKLALDVVELFKGSAEQNDITLQAHIQDDISPAPMDPEGIHICLTNLVSNALDACQTSDDSNVSVTVRCFECDDSIVFEVEDNGVGMDYLVKQKVFTNFFTTKGSGGTGIGLLQTRRITQQHGGNIDLESTLGQGSTFRLTFPRGRLPRHRCDQPPNPKDQGSAP